VPRGIEDAVVQIGGWGFTMAFGKLVEWLRSPRFAALNYNGTTNLGDEIQTIAAMRFIPRVDAWVDRERLDEFRSWRDHRIILNGWFLHRPDHWPPAINLKPLIISFHLTNVISSQNRLGIPPSRAVLGAQGVEYLRSHEPIGARDLHTLRKLRSAGVNAYFSGCLTLTLSVDDAGPRSDSVYAIDVSDEVFSALSRRCIGPLIRLSHVDKVSKGNARIEKAKTLLRNYASARSVVTSRLHCALPCLALGTPVLFIEAAPDSYRFDGLRDFLHRASEKEVLENQTDFDPNAPPSNGVKWHALRDRLIASCLNFVREKENK
jgi:hypothetical protein